MNGACSENVSTSFLIGSNNRAINNIKSTVDPNNNNDSPRRLKWVNWLHKNVADDNPLDEVSSLKEPPTDAISTTSTTTGAMIIFVDAF